MAGKPGIRQRLIPAHAGKTSFCPKKWAASPAHPRSRGENFRCSFRVAPGGGSSPLTRGKPWSTRRSRNTPRLIPAHAGKTSLRAILTHIEAAHPRSRGENSLHDRCRRDAHGSSPLTRGKPALPHSVPQRPRLIPAHAGKTRPIRRRRRPRSAHPRSRGENARRSRRAAAARGSSPLTRGKHFPTCAFTAQIDQILETLELAVSSGSYSVWVACATDAPQDQVRSIGLVLPSSRGAS